MTFTHEVKVNFTCPWCCEAFECASSVGVTAKTPKAGSVTICIKCGCWAVVTRALNLRKPNGKESRAIATNLLCKTVHEAWLLASLRKGRKQ